MGSIRISQQEEDFQPSLTFVVVGVLAGDGSLHGEQNIAGKLRIIISIFLFWFFS
jgi:hypothetical protein